MGISDQYVWTCTEPSVLKMDDKTRSRNLEPRMSFFLHELQVRIDYFVFIIFPPGTRQRDQLACSLVYDGVHERIGRHLQTRPKNKTVTHHQRSSYHAGHPDCPLVFASIALACSVVMLNRFSTASTGLIEAHDNWEEHKDDTLAFTGVFSSTSS